VGLGTVFGLMAMSKWDDAKSGCDPTGCAPDHVDQGHSAATLGNVSTVAFIVGALGLAGGAFLWFTAPKAAPKATAARWLFGQGTF
jgi:hypothetical protein